MQCLTEKTFIGDDFAFSVTDAPDGIYVAMCTEEEYHSTPSPDYHFVGKFSHIEGWTIEKVEAILDDSKFLADAMKTYMASLSNARKINRESIKTKEEMLIEEVKQEIQKSAETSAQACWTLEEASKYSKIGINRLRTESGKKGCPWVLWVADTKRVVKVDAFKKWLDDIRRVE